MSEIDVTKCTRYCTDNGKCTAFKGIYLCSERTNCYIKRIIKKQIIIDKLNKQLHRYKQAIEEIKEIADDRSIYCENCSGGVEDFTCNDCGYIKIIQKCEEIK